MPQQQTKTRGEKAADEIFFAGFLLCPGCGAAFFYLRLYEQFARQHSLSALAATAIVQLALMIACGRVAVWLVRWLRLPMPQWFAPDAPLAAEQGPRTLPFDAEKRRLLVAKILTVGNPNDQATPLPLVSVAEFFDGNNDEGSIGCNLNDHPGMRVFQETLEAIRQRPEVQDVLVAISEVQPEDDATWPFAEVVFVLTSADQAEVETWVKPLQPDSVSVGWHAFRRVREQPLKPGMKAYLVWWD